jgi:hypothetical protein
MSKESGRTSRQSAQEPARPVRFDATIHPGRGAKDLAPLDDLALDRVPDRYGRVRALVTAEECATLLDLGYEVRLHRAHPIGPLDPRLVETDESAQRWLDERLAALRQRPVVSPGDTTTRKRRKG